MGGGHGDAFDLVSISYQILFPENTQWENWVVKHLCDTISLVTGWEKHLQQGFLNVFFFESQTDIYSNLYRRSPYGSFVFINLGLNNIIFCTEHDEIRGILTGV